jgi:hypothetical protein
MFFSVRNARKDRKKTIPRHSNAIPWGYHYGIGVKNAIYRSRDKRILIRAVSGSEGNYFYQNIGNRKFLNIHSMFA